MASIQLLLVIFEALKGFRFNLTEKMSDNLPSAMIVQDMSLLEVKHGLLQISETLNFLHNNAHLIHRAISPEVTFSRFLVILTSHVGRFYVYVFLTCRVLTSL